MIAEVFFRIRVFIREVLCDHDWRPYKLSDDKLMFDYWIITNDEGEKLGACCRKCHKVKRHY